MKRGHLVAAVALAAALVLGAVDSVDGQTPYVTPEAGWSDLRGLTVGGRVGTSVVAGLDVALQGLVSFPDESGVAEPDVGVDRTSWQASANAMYIFDRTRGLAPYVGGGLRYGKASLTLIVDGLQASRRLDGFGTNVLAGVRLPRLSGHPFVEVRWGDRTWTMTVGVLSGLGAL